MEHFDAIVVGAGQAGLAVIHELGAAGVEHVVLERGRIGQSWRRYREFMNLLKGRAMELGTALRIEEPGTVDSNAPESLDLSGFGAVIFAGGFRPEYRSWLPWPQAFDDVGFPIQKDGASSIVPGLFFAGVHFLRTRKSSLLFGVGEDATIVARQIAAALAIGKPGA